MHYYHYCYYISYFVTLHCSLIDIEKVQESSNLAGSIGSDWAILASVFVEHSY